MTKRETVMSWLEGLTCYDWSEWHSYNEVQEIAKAALELLKEQEAVEPIYSEEKYGDHLPHCGNCEKVIPNNAVYGKVNFCHYCGTAVKWNV